jgi:putative transposase
MDDNSERESQFAWPHAPLHSLGESGIYIVTAGTYQKQRLFDDETRLQAVHDGLIRYAARHRWQLEAWAVFANHYHFVARSPTDAFDGAASLSRFVNELHSRSARWLNELDRTPGRLVWHNFWETRLTHETSYLARLNYVHQNAVKHGLVVVANQYRWCSAAWFERTASQAQIRTIYGFKTDRIKVLDDY